MGSWDQTVSAKTTKIKTKTKTTLKTKTSENTVSKLSWDGIAS